MENQSPFPSNPMPRQPEGASGESVIFPRDVTIAIRPEEQIHTFPIRSSSFLHILILVMPFKSGVISASYNAIAFPTSSMNPA